MRHHPHAYFQVVSLAGILLLMLGAVQAQDSPPLTSADGTTSAAPGQNDSAQDENADGADPQGMSFEQIVKKVRANEKQINQLYSTIPIGFPKLQEEYIGKINTLKKSNVALKEQLDVAAIRAYRKAPKENRLAAQMVFRGLMKKIELSSANQHFDPQGALEIADMMLETDLDAEPQGPVRMADVAYQAFLASYAMDDFARADLMLKKIEDSGVPLRSTMRTELTDAQEKWKRELLIRQLESNADDLPRVKLETTEGDIVVELYENHAPQTVGNFISLVERNFYNDLSFFHVKPGRIAETGSPEGDGSGDAGYKIPCECDQDEIRHHFSGTLSMANDGPDTGGSRFFIAYQRNGQLDGKNTVFGRVIEGMDVVKSLKPAGALSPLTRLDEKDEDAQTTILKATVIRKRDHEYTPSRVADNPDATNSDGGIREPGLETADNQSSGN